MSKNPVSRRKAEKAHYERRKAAGDRLVSVWIKQDAYNLMTALRTAGSDTTESVIDLAIRRLAER